MKKSGSYEDFQNGDRSGVSGLSEEEPERPKSTDLSDLRHPSVVLSEEDIEPMKQLYSSDAHTLVEKFRQAYEGLSHDLGRKPNVLIAGCTGAGKSTLVNKVFGQQVAQTGSGVPITQHFNRYELPGHSVVIYDSKGLEVGEHENFIRTTKEFLKDSSPDSEHAIHVVWYIINSAGSRFQPFEGEVCKSLFDKIPIIFILNKADLSSAADRQSLRDTIQNLKLGNFVAVLDTICTPSLNALKIPDVCPKCGSDDLDVKRKKQQVKCEECDYTASLSARTGLEDVVTRTVQSLPTIAREQFVAAQRVSVQEKSNAARHIILDFFKSDFAEARRKNALFNAMAKMLIRLSIVWEFRENERLYTPETKGTGEAHFSFRDRLFLLMHSNYTSAEKLQAHTGALGVLWNRCVRNLYSELFRESFGTMTTSYDTDVLDKELPKLLASAFSELTLAAVQRFEQVIFEKGLTGLLDAEMPEDLAEGQHISLDPSPYTGNLRSSAPQKIERTDSAQSGSTKVSAPKPRAAGKAGVLSQSAFSVLEKSGGEEFDGTGSSGKAAVKKRAVKSKRSVRKKPAASAAAEAVEHSSGTTSQETDAVASANEAAVSKRKVTKKKSAGKAAKKKNG